VQLPREKERKWILTEKGKKLLDTEIEEMFNPDKEHWDGIQKWIRWLVIIDETGTLTKNRYNSDILEYLEDNKYIERV